MNSWDGKRGHAAGLPGLAGYGEIKDSTDPFFGFNSSFARGRDGFGKQHRVVTARASAGRDFDFVWHANFPAAFETVPGLPERQPLGRVRHARFGRKILLVVLPGD